MFVSTIVTLGLAAMAAAAPQKRALAEVVYS